MTFSLRALRLVSLDCNPLLQQFYVWGFFVFVFFVLCFYTATRDYQGRLTFISGSL